VTDVFGSIVIWADSTANPACSSARRTSPTLSAGHVISKTDASRDTSSAPPSAAASMSSSSSTPSAETSNRPVRSNNHATEPDSPSDPSLFEKT
jgi:hypothetical protein